MINAHRLPTKMVCSTSAATRRRGFRLRYSKSSARELILVSDETERHPVRMLYLADVIGMTIVATSAVGGDQEVLADLLAVRSFEFVIAHCLRAATMASG